MNYRFIRGSSLIVPITKRDTLFSGRYIIDPYQNCEFRCGYCDSATNETVYIKSNAVELLEKEIRHLPKGVIIIGSVHDPYQHAEQIYEITRTLLQHIQQYKFPVHILTKSSLILRDIDILSTLHQCSVTVSITSLKASLASLFEPQAPSPQKRLQTVKKLAKQGIKTGIALIPIIPFCIEDELEHIISSAAKSQADYFLYTFLELKGDQKEAFLQLIKTTLPQFTDQFSKLYKDNIKPLEAYTKMTEKKINTLCKKYKLRTTIT